MLRQSVERALVAAELRIVWDSYQNLHGHEKLAARSLQEVVDAVRELVEHSEILIDSLAEPIREETSTIICSGLRRGDEKKKAEAKWAAPQYRNSFHLRC